MTHPACRITDFENRSVLLIASWTLGAASAAFAQGVALPAVPSAAADPEVTANFLKADKNGDGKLSREEAASVLPSVVAFDQADTDKDGAVSQAEFIKAMTKK